MILLLSIKIWVTVSSRDRKHTNTHSNWHTNTHTHSQLVIISHSPRTVIRCDCIGRFFDAYDEHLLQCARTRADVSAYFDGVLFFRGASRNVRRWATSDDFPVFINCWNTFSKVTFFFQTYMKQHEHLEFEYIFTKKNTNTQTHQVRLKCGTRKN